MEHHKMKFLYVVCIPGELPSLHNYAVKQKMEKLLKYFQIDDLIFIKQLISKVQTVYSFICYL